MARPASLLGVVAVVVLFCAPLFINLGGLDLHSDEAIYAYAVDRIIETGTWLTPRSIPVDGPFLEKPPLRLWVSAALIRAGLLPHDESGYRAVDAFFGATAFLYIYIFGLRLAGPVAGVVSVLVVFMFEPIIFEHPLRTYSMEALLFLSYCGGAYHFTRWVDAHGRSQRHAFAVCAWFAVGFMTKFVAALFLPIVLVFTALIAPPAREKLATRWRDWPLPIFLAISVIAPWFLYESWVHGELFWDSIFGQHVYRRFTGGLDPVHIQPWHFYATETWRVLLRAGSGIIALAGLLALFVTAWKGRPWQMRLLVVWLVIPYVIISLSPSKLIHYAFPFFPPVAFGAGWFVDALVHARGAVLQTITRHIESGFRRAAAALLQTTVLSKVMIAIAAAAAAISLATALNGRITWTLGGVKVFQNSSVVRPLVLAAVLIGLAGQAVWARRLLLAIVFGSILPVSHYATRVAQANSTDDQLRTVRSCAVDVRNASGGAAGVYNAARGFPHHSFYYYLRSLGPWIEPEQADPVQLHDRLFVPGRQSPVLMMRTDYQLLQPPPGSGSIPPAVIVHGLVVIFPGPYSTCAARVRAAGAAPAMNPRTTSSIP